MTSFFDASLLESHEHHERSFVLFADADRSHACCGAHSLAELYATLTRLPGKSGLSADHALLSLDSVAERLELITLDAGEYQDAIRQAAGVGIIGGAIYDALLARCALKAHATRIYTWDLGHFRMLGAEVAGKVRTPQRRRFGCENAAGLLRPGLTSSYASETSLWASPVRSRSFSREA